jgi:hypothetical protein
MSALADICARANLPPAPPAQPSPEQAIAKANASLAASVARKQGEAKAIAFEVLIDSVTQIRAHVPPLPLPAWVPAVKAEFEKSYARIEGYRQRQLLGRFANILRPPELGPLLEGVMDAWSLGGQPMDARAALRSLYLIDPARAQARILAELAKQRTWLDAPLFDLLPPARAPITDDELIQDLAAGGNSPLEMTALAKYASPQALPRIRAIYESQRDSCQPELMAYFVRVDPEYADRVFHSHPWEMHAAPPACTARYFETTPRIAAGPVLERYMIAYLMHEDPRLKVAAARSLARFGSPAALAPLWDAFRYFHDYWKGKTQELAQTGAGRGLEDELRDAVARGRHWLVTEADLRVIQSLCISDYCRDSTEIDLGALQMPVKIQMGSQAGEAQGQVAQYAFESMEELEEKLSQFPKGTPFSLHAFGEGAGEAAIRIRDYAAAHGLTVALQ